jgi:coenzyme F420-reducing hydrogenase gamma subunit
MDTKQLIKTKPETGKQPLLRIATVWFGGCSGCHMSFLDLDEFLIELAGKAEIVFSPVMDVKEYPEQVDVCLIEGAICNEDNLELLHKVRTRTKVLVSFGDCAVTANVQRRERPAEGLHRGGAAQSGRAQGAGHRARAAGAGDAGA